MRPLAHDVTTPNREGEFSDVPMFVHRIMVKITELAPRILDTGKVVGAHVVNMHVFLPYAGRGFQPI